MHGAKDHFDPALPPLRLVGGPDDYDALAELFLGGESRSPQSPRASEPKSPPERPSQSSATPREPEIVVRPHHTASERGAAPATSPLRTVEALILGHLPVRSTVWIAQYARARAESLRRPVALLRVSASESSLDLYGVPIGTASPELAPTIEHAVQRAHTMARDWIVQVDELNEPSLAADDRLSSITLLTSANETAIIAAYRAIKGLASAAKQIAEPPSHPQDAESPSLRIAIMGASPDESSAALSRLQNACSVFLGRPLELAATVTKIAPAPGASLYRGPTPELPSLLELISRDTPTPQVIEPKPEPQVIQPSEVRQPPAPRVVTPAAPARSADSLAAHIPGLRALPATYPDDAAIELAVDESGRLNLLRRSDCPDACQRLVAAVAWAKRHADLLALSAAAIARMDASLPPVARLFTATPPSMRPLLDTEIRVHLLARADDASPWLCVELN